MKNEGRTNSQCQEIVPSSGRKLSFALLSSSNGSNEDRGEEGLDTIFCQASSHASDSDRVRALHAALGLSVTGTTESNSGTPA